MISDYSLFTDQLIASGTDFFCKAERLKTLGLLNKRHLGIDMRF